MTGVLTWRENLETDKSRGKTVKTQEEDSHWEAKEQSLDQMFPSWSSQGANTHQAFKLLASRTVRQICVVWPIQFVLLYFGSCIKLTQLAISISEQGPLLGWLELPHSMVAVFQKWAFQEQGNRNCHFLSPWAWKLAWYHFLCVLLVKNQKTGFYGKEHKLYFVTEEVSNNFEDMGKNHLQNWYWETKDGALWIFLVKK